MFSNIPPQRLLIYTLVVGIIPILIIWYIISSNLNNIYGVQDRIWSLAEQAYIKEKKQASNLAIRQNYRDADHFYIDKNLETLTFLEPEIDSMKKLLNNPNYPDDEQMKKRIEQLTGPTNSLIFTEGVVQSTPIFQEVVETLVHTVEVDVKDLQSILCRIEGIAIGDCVPPPNRPQLIITDFKIDKKTVTENNQVFLLNLKLLRREFL